ncbi:STAS domain-containing protein [Streptomyces actinomycinicus]|uniref:Anti-sigma factor antagonist n=1 Tax=Streptomyces actinomycinicus TaxID=1695166 RepID=A0A937JPJ2_9ACTN|nr:STAS domain-containing protein [Streptomyces actinomycinicus]MBL1086889.1 STAS domain-containing protein [Streptomyces actinomycinicus]
MSENDTVHAAEHDTGQNLVIAHRVVGDANVVTLRGEVDLLSVPALSERLDALTARPQPDLVVDLRSVHFIDCAGLGVLCRARNRALARKGRIRLIAEDANFRRTLRATGLGGVFEVHARVPHPLPEATP